MWLLIQYVEPDGVEFLFFKKSNHLQILYFYSANVGKITICKRIVEDLGKLKGYPIKDGMNFRLLSVFITHPIRP